MADWLTDEPSRPDKLHIGGVFVFARPTLHNMDGSLKTPEFRNFLFCFMYFKHDHIYKYGRSESTNKGRSIMACVSCRQSKVKVVSEIV
jgi:hypothetical protein